MYWSRSPKPLRNILPLEGNQPKIAQLLRIAAAGLGGSQKSLNDPICAGLKVLSPTALLEAHERIQGRCKITRGAFLAFSLNDGQIKFWERYLD